MSFKVLNFASMLVLSIWVSACASTPEASRNVAGCDAAQNNQSESLAAVCQAPAPSKTEPDHSWHQSDRGGRFN
jgi:hypothetical protein